MHKVEYEDGRIVKKVYQCNKCGKTRIYGEAELAIYLDWRNRTNNIALDFGYSSPYDGQEWSFDLCDDCLTEFIKTFKYIPDGFMDDNCITLDDNDRQTLFEEWKRTGQWEEFSVLPYEELLDLVGYIDKQAINDIILKYHPDRKSLE